MNDPLSELLRIAGVRGALIRRARLAAPYGVAAPDQARAVFHVALRGDFVLSCAGDDLAVPCGAVVVVPRGAAHRILDAPGRPARAIDRFPVEQAPGTTRSLSVMHDGADRADLKLLCGTFALGAPADRWLLDPLPEAFVVDGGAAAAAFVQATLQLLEQTLTTGGLGARLVSDRLVEVLVVHLLKGWAAERPHLEGWLGALRDPGLARALGAIHGDVARDWPLETLARTAGMSRSTFAATFRERVGVAPGQFVIDWRMAVARRALREGASVTLAAERAGYASEASFSRAFKRHAGTSPAAWRHALS